MPELAWHSAEPEVLTSFALSLLLVFRTNSSYARWDDARKMWGGITNKSRDLMRLVRCWSSHTLLRD
jgi:putative membrane protein